MAVARALPIMAAILLLHNPHSACAQEARPYLIGLEPALMPVVLSGIEKVKMVTTMAYLAANDTSQCSQDFVAYAKALTQYKRWAVNMLDATANPGSGMLNFRFRWTGNFDQCQEVAASYNTNISGQFKERHFRGRYCKGILGAVVDGVPESDYGNFWAFCVPDSCGPMEFAYAAGTSMYILGVSPVTIVYGDCYEDIDVSPSAIGMMSVVCFFGLLVVLGTALDLYICYSEGKRSEDKNNMERKADRAVTNGGFDSAENGVKAGEAVTTLTNTSFSERKTTDVRAVNNGGADNSHPVPGEVNSHAAATYNVTPGNKPTESKQPNMALRLLLCFSFWTNGKRLFDTRQASGSLGCVNGIRVLSFAWVSLGHTWLFFSFTSDTVTEFRYQSKKDWAFQAIDNFTFCVDSFLVLGGLLVAYVTLRELKKTKGKKNWLLFFVHRYIRITPLYMILVGVWTAWMAYWYSGPFWPKHDTQAICKDNFWLNLLYVQNIVLADEFRPACFGWAWYLALDMQFYFLSPLIVAPLFFKPVLGYVSAGIFFLATTITPWVLSASRNYGTEIAKVANAMETDDKRQAMYYEAPYCRMGPYVIGILLGYVIFKTNGKLRIPRWANALGWLLSTALAIFLIYCFAGDVEKGYSEGIGLHLAAAYNALSRSAFALCVAWVIFSCHHGYGGVVNSFLSWGFFVPLGRLSYCAYLIHPILYLIVGMASRVPLNLEYFTYTQAFLANIFASFIVSIFLSLAFEVPFLGIDKIIFKKK